MRINTAGVMPIILNNSETRLTNFIKHLRKLGVPFVEISDVSELVKYSKDISGDLCRDLLNGSNMTSVYNLEQLKVSFYDYN